MSSRTFPNDETCSTEELLAQARNRLTKVDSKYFEYHSTNNSSHLNNCRHNEVVELQRKLHKYQMTRLEVFNKCAYLWCKIKSIDTKNAEAKKCRQQNAKMREESANMERDFINEVSKLAHEMEDSKKRFPHPKYHRLDMCYFYMKNYELIAHGKNARL